MSDTTFRYPAGLAECVAAYVREVRAELADLPAEDVDDLTGGMEADLSELATESGGDLIGRLGTPGLYAAELRAAAGLPDRAVGSGGRQHRPLREQVALDRASLTRLVGRHPWLRLATDFMVTLRPAWWLLRGYLAAWALWSMLSGNTRGVRPHSFLHLVMAIAAIVVSVQLGRGWLKHRAVTSPLLVLANSALVVTALVASVSTDVSYYSGNAYSPSPGVSLDGAQVGNIYVYDSNGNRMTGVRLFAQDGQPLGGGDDAFDPNGNPMGVVRDGSGAPVTNVYPRLLFGQDPWQVIDPADPQVNQGAWTPPVFIVPLAPSSTATASGTATASAPAPTSKPMPPTSASTTPASGPSPSVTRSGR